MNVGIFMIATSDQDFRHLAHHLKESGFKVVIAGESKAPDALLNSGSEFVELKHKNPKSPDPFDQQIHQHHDQYQRKANLARLP